MELHIFFVFPFVTSDFFFDSIFLTLLIMSAGSAEFLKNEINKIVA